MILTKEEFMTAAKIEEDAYIDTLLPQAEAPGAPVVQRQPRR